LLKGANGAGNDRTEQQLEIIKNLQQKDEPPPKIQKVDDEQKPSRSTKVDESEELSKSATEKLPLDLTKSPKQPTTQKLNSPSPGSALHRKQEEKNFFKERSQMFKAKDPEEMRAKSPKSSASEPKASTSNNTFNPSTERNMEEAMKAMLAVRLPRGQMAEKLRNSAPYNMFLTAVTAAPETHSDPLSVTFQELLDSSLGELESSVQINFMVDIGWLLAHYAFAKYKNLPLLVLYGSDDPTVRDINRKRPNVTTVKVQIPTPFGVHHTKMMLFFYKDKSMRVVVSTANLYEDDWENRTQGLWISDRLPGLPEGVSHTTQGESSTKFRADLMRYLNAYNIPKLTPIIARIRESDFSSVNVFLITSVPGSHRDSGRGIHYGHPRVATLLTENSAPIDDSSPIILQASSIGSLGSSSQAFICGEIASSFKRDSAPVGLRRLPNVKLVYPSLNNVLNSHDGINGGGCLPYTSKTHEKQLWLKDHLCQWKASSRNRNRAMPHIKSYFRYSDRGLYWFILTSANVSKAAWGILNKVKSLNTSLRINSYEAGVAFFPRVILGRERFPMNEAQQKDESPIFKVPFDVPLLPYAKDDEPYCSEYLKDYLKKKFGNGTE
jgi:tyrosyl-DNA phosphodiesterase 1